jgi:hypothetical protein
LISRIILRGLPALLVPCGAASASMLRIATYNVDNSDTASNANVSMVATILQAIGNHHINGNAQPVDVVGLQELLDTNDNTITSSTLPALVGQLNSLYGPGTYAYDPTPDPTTGGFQFNGPSGLIYNTKTIQVISAESLPYDFDSGNGVFRAPMRYQLRPVGYGSNADFYMYVSHYKSGSGSSNATLRNTEAAEIRADADALGPTAHILYTGDHNLFGSSGEPSYQTLMGPGVAQAHDPASFTQVWNEDAAHVDIESGNSTGVQFREDAEFTSGNVYNQSGVYTQPGLRLSNGGVGSYIVFGNGSSPTVPAGGAPQSFGGSADYPGNLSLNDLANASDILSDLVTATDHLPVVADYDLVGVNKVPEPATCGIIALIYIALRDRCSRAQRLKTEK